MSTEVKSCPETAKALEIVTTIAECIRELGSVPNGHLYALVTPYMSLDQYNKVLATLKGANLIEETNHVLTWTGPQLSG